MKFKISSALKDHIGKELITDDNVAIFELVKNSYDADAKKIKIVFQDMRSQFPKILIIDNGTGMSEDDLENKWLFVAYSSKKDLKNLKTKRLMAGSKGIGRFSCDRLGSKLKIYTKIRTDKNFNLLSINWDKFEKDQKKEFKEIDVDLKRGQTPIDDLGVIGYSGTILEISDLRHEWDWKKIQKLKRYLQRLINPLQIPGGDKFEIELIAKDFIANDNKQKYNYDKINGIVENRAYEELKVKTTTIECNISNDGKEIKTSLDDKGINIFELTEDNPFNLRDIRIKVSYLNEQAKSTFTRLMGVRAIDYGNLFVFKNGFRVFPYGEEDNDWLQINKRKAQGYNRYLGTREVLGRIEINDIQNEFFKEATSRSEGLIDNEHFIQLKEFVLNFVIKRLEKYVVGAIDWDSDRENNPDKERKNFGDIKKDTLKIIRAIAGGSLENKKLRYNKDFLEIVEEKTIEKIPRIIKNLESTIKKEKDKEIKLIYNQQIQSLKQGLKFQKEKQKEEIEEKEQEVKKIKSELDVKEKESLFLTSIVSSDLQNVINLHHHIKISSINVKRAIKEILKKIDEGSLDETYLKNKLQKMSLENDKISSVATFATKANFKLEGNDMKKDLTSFIADYIENICREIYRGQNGTEISFNVESKDKDKFVTWFKPIEITIILDNLINNSLKAKAKNITLNFSKKSKELLLTYSDDGNGITRENKSQIFNYGFTTTNGSGMGLYHIKKILSDMGGKIKVIDSKEGAVFEITFVLEK